MSARLLTVGPSRENSRRTYWPVAPFDAPTSAVTVSYHHGYRTWLCHTCYREQKPTCKHVEAVQDHLGASAPGTTAAPERAAHTDAAA